MNTTTMSSQECQNLSSERQQIQKITFSTADVKIIFRLRIQLVADGYFKEEFKFKTVEKVTAVFNHLKTYYSHPSLGVKFDLVKLPVKIIPDKVLIANRNIG